MQVQAYPMDEAGNPPRILWFSVTVSMICHLVFFMLMIIIPNYKPDRSFSTSVIDVSLVNLPSSPASTSGRQQRPASKDSPIPDSTPQPVKEAHLSQEQKKPEEVSLSPKQHRVKTSLKKETFESSKALKHAISEIKKTINQSRAQSVTEAIDRLGDAVDDAKGIGTTEGIHTQGQKALEVMDIYKAEIPYHIQKNWVFSEQLAGTDSTDLVAWLVIAIKSDGHISDIWFEKRSGNRYFDDQAYKAVIKSDPLPSLPREYLRPFFNVGLRFTSSGLK